MEGLVAARGIAKVLGNRADVVGFSHEDTGTTSTLHKSNLRIDGKDVVFHGAAIVADGDQVVAFGGIKNSVLESHALFNFSSGASYPAKVTTLNSIAAACWSWLPLWPPYGCGSPMAPSLLLH